MGSCFFGGKIDRNNVSKGKNNLPKQLKDIKQLRLATVAASRPRCRGVHWAGQPMGPTSRRFLLSGYPTQRSNLHVLDQVTQPKVKRRDPMGPSIHPDVFTMDGRDL